MSDTVISLIQNKNHKLPIIIPESDKILYILTYKCILNYLKMFITEFLRPEFAFKSLEELKIIIYANTAMVCTISPVYMARHLCTVKFSAMPVVDEKGHVVDIYFNSDVINLAAEKTYSNLDVPVTKGTLITLL